jgi:hypothetical protein
MGCKAYLKGMPKRINKNPNRNLAIHPIKDTKLIDSKIPSLSTSGTTKVSSASMKIWSLQ